MQSDHAGIAGQEADNLSGLSGRNLPAQSFLRSGLVTMIPAKLPKLPWFLHAGPILVVRRSGQTAQKVWWPASPAQPLLPLHHHILLLLLQALVVPTPTA